MDTFLHTSGGVSISSDNDELQQVFSPHQWRCFHGKRNSAQKAELFSTPVEVFLRCNRKTRLSPSFLHTSGGVSYCCLCASPSRVFSPHQWRCFLKSSRSRKRKRLFSTPVEVFPKWAKIEDESSTFLHASGGVSYPNAVHISHRDFSPRQWRCFLQRFGILFTEFLFSTLVEVFLH